MLADGLVVVIGSHEVAKDHSEHCEPLEHAPRISRSSSTECLVDFFEARSRLLADLAGSAEQIEIAERAYRTFASEKRSSKRTDILEAALYWLISAPALAYLILVVLGF
jgi:hypothetical protein